MRKFLFTLALLTATPVMAAEKPAEITPFVKADAPYGTGTVTFAFMSIYDATLWTDAHPFSWDKPFALHLLYHHHLTRSGLVDKTIELMKQEGKVPADKLKAYGDQLMHIWSDVQSGDTITAVYQPQGKTLFFYNGKPSGSIDDPTFARPFFDIWLSPDSTEPKMRAGLMSGSR